MPSPRCGVAVKPMIVALERWARMASKIAR
jgi:hypothetical protein